MELLMLVPIFENQNKVLTLESHNGFNEQSCSIGIQPERSFMWRCDLGVSKLAALTVVEEGACKHKVVETSSTEANQTSAFEITS